MLDGSLSASPKALSWLRAPTPPWPSGLVLPTAFQEHGSDHAPEPQGERGSCYREEDNNHSLKMWNEATTKSTKSRADGGAAPALPTAATRGQPRAARRGCCQRRCNRCAPRAAPASSSSHFPPNDSPWGRGSGGPWTKAPGKNPFLPGHRKRRQFPGLGHRRRLIRGYQEWVRGRVRLLPEA